MNISKKLLFSCIASTAVILISSFCPTLSINQIIGSRSWHFALLPVLAPLLGALYGPLALVGFALLWVVRFPWWHLAEITCCRLLLALHLPTIGATWYCATHNAVRLFIPTSCMLLFWLHPVGAQAWGYALYWIIPLAIAFIPRPAFWLTALGSSFTAHAIGSVLWLYGGLLIQPAAWIALIPVVALERLIMTLCMVVGYTAWNTITTKKRGPSQRKMFRKIEGAA